MRKNLGLGSKEGVVEVIRKVSVGEGMGGEVGE